MGKINDTKRAMAIQRRKKIQSKMKRLRALYQEAKSEKEKEGILLLALKKNRYMSKNDFLLIPAVKRERKIASTHTNKTEHKSAPGKSEKKLTEKKAV